MRRAWTGRCRSLVRALAAGVCSILLAAQSSPTEKGAGSHGNAQPLAELSALSQRVLGKPQRWPKLEIPIASESAPEAQQPGTSGRTLDVKTLVSAMLADTEDAWDDLFARLGRRYEQPVMVIYSRVTRTECGAADARASGPFYCEKDRRVYLDLDFLDELLSRNSVGGDMAQFYIIAHEIGHHVQRVLGILEAVGRLERDLDSTARNALSVRVELQADCLAGVTAYHMHRQKKRLEPGDVELGLRTASALGSDRLQKLAYGVVQPETFTHGSSAQRWAWFRKGVETGDLGGCQTFGSAEP